MRSTVTTLRAGQSRKRASISGRVKRFFPFQKNSDQLCGPPRPTFNKCQVHFPLTRRTEREADYSPIYLSKVWVQLHIYSPKPSWLKKGQLYPLILSWVAIRATSGKADGHVAKPVGRYYGALTCIVTRLAEIKWVSFQWLCQTVWNKSLLGTRSKAPWLPAIVCLGNMKPE